jgi:hypothetical protein
METDLRAALPGSLRWRRTGNIVVLEMLPVLGVARYKTTPSAVSFTTAGTYAGVTPDYLAVNPDANVYNVSGSMAAASGFSAGPPIAGEQVINVNPAPAFGPDSPKRSIYYVSRPVTYLCDEQAGTLRRYANYTLAAVQTARDTAAKLNAAGATSALVTQGLSTCDFQVSAASATQSQTVAVHLTTTRNGDVVALLHSSHAEYVP